jgi:hypothetical protein
MKAKLAMLLLAAAAVAPTAKAGVFITEFSYKALFGEFVEVTNTGASPVDVNGWRYSDNHGLAGAETLFTSSTVLHTNESFIITEVSDAVFEQAWYTDSGVGRPASLIAVFENNAINLGKSDEINIYDSSSSTPVDTLTFSVSVEDDSMIPGPTTVLGSNTIATWVLSSSTVGHGGVAWKAGAPAPSSGPIGSPGVYPN